MQCINFKDKLINNKISLPNGFGGLEPPFSYFSASPWSSQKNIIIKKLSITLLTNYAIKMRNINPLDHASCRVCNECTYAIIIPFLLIVVFPNALPISFSSSFPKATPLDGSLRPTPLGTLCPLLKQIDKANFPLESHVGESPSLLTLLDESRSCPSY